MGQAEVLKLLEKQDGYLKAETMANILNASYSSVIRALTKMLRFGEVEKKIVEEKRYNTKKIYLWRAVEVRS